MPYNNRGGRGGGGYRGGGSGSSGGGRYHHHSGGSRSGRGGRSSSRGGGRGGGGRGGHGHGGGANKPLVNLCGDFTSTGNCERHKTGSCNFNHSIQCLSTVLNSKPDPNANHHHSSSNYNNHNTDKKFYATSDVTLWLENNSSQLKIFTSSHDGHWRLYNTSNGQFTVEVEHNLNGKIHTILVKHNFLFCGFEAISTKIPNEKVGMILAWNLSNPSDQPMELHMGSTPASSLLSPYAHSRGVTSLITHDDLCISGGQDHIIRIWKFDPLKNSNKGGFHLMKECCGHVGDVTGLVFVGGMLWSCSVDGTIRIWDSNSNWECKHLITGPPCTTDNVGCGTTINGVGGTSAASDASTHPGHTGPITCLIHYDQRQLQDASSPTAATNTAAGSFILSASLDGTVKVWDCANGNCLSTTHPLDFGITSMALMKEPKNGQPILILGVESGSMYILSVLQSLKAGAMSVLGKIDQKFLNRGHSGAVKSVVAGPPSTPYANTFYSVGSDGNMIIWQVVDDIGMT